MQALQPPPAAPARALPSAGGFRPLRLPAVARRGCASRPCVVATVAEAANGACGSTVPGGLPTAAAAVATVPVTFQVLLKVSYGEQVRVVGGHPALGNWQAEIAPNLHWGEGHLWTATVELPAGRPVEFKFLHVTHDRVYNWEGIANRCITPTASGMNVVSTNWEWASGPVEILGGQGLALQPGSEQVLDLLTTPAFAAAAVPPSWASGSPAAASAGPQQQQQSPAAAETGAEAPAAKPARRGRKPGTKNSKKAAAA